MKQERKETKRKIIQEGNSFYEIDLDCVERKQRTREEMEKKRGSADYRDASL